MKTPPVNTFVVTLRIDIRNAALLHKILAAQNLTPANPSALASMSLNLFGDIIEAKGYSRFDSTAEALQYLQENEVMPQNIRKHRNYRTLVNQLALEDGTLEELSVATTQGVQQPIIAPPSENMEAALRRRLKEFKQTQSVLTNIPKELLDG